MKKMFCALALLSTTSLYAMAESAVVNVTGTIQTASSCALTLENPDELNYGTIDPNEIGFVEYIKLPIKYLDIKIECGAATKVALSALNGQPGTMAGSTENVAGVGRAPLDLFNVFGISGAGLGLSGGKKIGGYALILHGPSIADGKVLSIIEKRDSDAAWVSSYAGSMYRVEGELLLSYAAKGKLTPIAVKSLTSGIAVQPYLNMRDQLDLNSPITLDGKSTIELHYL